MPPSAAQTPPAHPPPARQPAPSRAPRGSAARQTRSPRSCTTLRQSRCRTARPARISPPNAPRKMASRMALPAHCKTPRARPSPPSGKPSDTRTAESPSPARPESGRTARPRHKPNRAAGTAAAHRPRAPAPGPPLLCEHRAASVTARPEPSRNAANRSPATSAPTGPGRSSRLAQR